MISVYFVRIYNLQGKTQSAFAMQCKYKKKQVEIGIFPQPRILVDWICWCAGGCRGLQARGLQKSMRMSKLLGWELTDSLGGLVRAVCPSWHFQVFGCGSVGKLFWFKWQLPLKMVLFLSSHSSCALAFFWPWMSWVADLSQLTALCSFL